jgi:hypothetical protein
MNVLLRQGYRTPRGVVTDECRAVVEWLAMEDRTSIEKPASLPVRPP